LLINRTSIAQARPAAISPNSEHDRALSMLACVWQRTRDKRVLHRHLSDQPDKRYLKHTLHRIMLRFHRQWAPEGTRWHFFTHWEIES
jgi:hypothetical protein